MIAIRQRRSDRKRRMRRMLAKSVRVEALEPRLLLDGKPLPDVDYSIQQFGSEEAFEQYMMDEARETYGHLFGQTTNWFPIDILPIDVLFLAGDLATPESAAVPPQSSSTSDTNVQVAGVDEDDLVETDGEYLYILSHEQLSIIDTRDVNDLQLVSQFQFEQNPTGMFLNGSRLTVISGGEDYWLEDTTTDVTVLDVQDPTDPQVVQFLQVEGSFIASRGIDDHVYLVSRNLMQLPTPLYECVDSDGPVDIEHQFPRGGGIVEPALVADGLIWWPPDTTCTYETWEEYSTRLEDRILDLTLPTLSVYSSTGELVEESWITPPEEVYRPIHEGPSYLTSVITIDVTGDQPGTVSTTSIPTAQESTLYVSLETIYVMSRQWGEHGTYTAISRLDLNRDTGETRLVANGAVPGYILNQFSVDHYDGHLRIATTDATWGGGSNVYVLEQHGELLEVIGSLEEIAVGEQLYAVRFMEETGYLVTFLRIDPLFTIDLSEPTEPRITGELEIPGFSEYLHPIGEDHLLGIGRIASADGPLREQISLFDVSEPVATVVERFTMDRNGWSAANTDHHAVSYYPEYQTLAIPFSETGWWGSPMAEFQSQLLLFRVDTDTGIDLVGEVSHDSAVFRSVRIGEYLFSIATDSVIVVEMDNPREILDEIHYPPLQVNVNPRINTGLWEGPVNLADTPTSWQQQHSDIQTIEITFNHRVEIRPEDIRLTNLGIHADRDADTVIELDETNFLAWDNYLNLRFEPNELPDGVYRLEILPSVTGAHGLQLDGNGDGVMGDSFVITGSFDNGLYKLAGDWNGDGGVSIFDFNTLSYWFGRPTVNQGGDAPTYVDLNQDGGISIFDFPAFARQYGTGLTFPTSLAAGSSQTGSSQTGSSQTLAVPGPVTSSSAARVTRDGDEIRPADEVRIDAALDDWTDAGSRIPWDAIDRDRPAEPEETDRALLEVMLDLAPIGREF